MSCPHCGHEAPAGSAFCNGCGAKLVLTCARCGATPPPGSRFCNGCGGTLGAAPASAAPERAPRDYTPKHLAEKILQSKSALEGERKQVTVLFADVKSSMELAQQIDPERWHVILNRYFEILTEGVHRFEGTVNQYTGDGIMALFGAPISHEDHAQRACYAALRLRDELRRYSDELRLSEGLDFAVRMGIHSGEVVVGSIGDDLRMDYTAQGHTVGLAARLEGLAPAHGVCLSRATADLVSGYVEVRDLGTATIKGVPSPVPVFELVGMGKITSRFDMSRARGLTRFVGRGDDMAVLEQAYQQAKAGNGQVVGVVAHAGTGKSRLCFEFAERCRARGLQVLSGTGVAHGKNIPFLPILQIFRQYFGISEQDSDRTAREKIAGRLLLIAEDFREFLPVMFDFMAVPDPDHPAPSMDPDARQRQLFQVMHRVVERGEGANINLIEDLHWIDAGSEAWLQQMVDATSGSRNLLVVNFRPEYRSAWMQKPWYRQLPLLPLGPEAIQELLDDLLGTDPSVRGLAALVYERTAGNPFFAEEVVQTLIESGSLEGSKGSYRLVTPIERIEVPATVKAVLAARIDRLAEREKQVLQAAAVIGKEFPEPILKAVLDGSDAELAGALQKLKNGEFLYEQSLYPVTEYAFKHPLTQEVALGSQLQERRARTHGRVARAMRTAHPDRLDEQAALLAHHYEEAGDRDEAARLHRRAALWLLKSDASESRAHWRRVLALVASLEATPEWQRLELEAADNLLSNGWRFGDVGEEERRLAARGIALAEQLRDRDTLSSITWGYAISLSCDGQIEAAEEPARRAVDLAEELDYAARVLSRSILFDVFWHSGRVNDAAALGEEIFALGAPDYSIGVDRFGLSIWNWQEARMGICHYLKGHPETARPLFAKSLEFAREHKQEEVASWILGWSGAQFEELTGEIRHALSNGQQAVDLAGRCGSPMSTTASLVHLGWAELLHGFPNEAVATLEHARHQHLVAKQARGWTDLTTGLLAEAYLAAGREQQAREMADAPILVPAARTNLLRARISQSRVFRALDGAAASDRIAALLGDAERLVEESGARAYAPLVAEERARLTALGDREQEARSQLRRALELYREVGATGHVRRLAAEFGE
jgi:class 3 adenylate cyclase/tetratricopeptide (TPR) repeat protein